MIIKTEKNLRNFEAWGGAIETKNLILDAEMEGEFESIIEEIYPDGLTDTKLNDILWFDGGWILETLGIEEEE